MKLEVGRKYERRDGKIAKCVFRVPDTCTSVYPFLVTHPHDDGDKEFTQFHVENGRWHLVKDDEPYDLVREHVEPSPLAIEVGRVYEDSVGESWKIYQKTGDDYRGSGHCSFGMVHCYWGVNGKSKGSWPNLIRDVTPEPANVIDGPGEYVCRDGSKDVVSIIENGIALNSSRQEKWYASDGRMTTAEERPGDIIGKWAEPKETAPEHPFAPADSCMYCSRPASEHERVSPYIVSCPAEPEPWTAEDVPMPVCWIRYKGIVGDKSMIFRIHTMGITVTPGNHTRHWEELASHWEYTTDGRVWKPCRKGHV